MRDVILAAPPGPTPHRFRIRFQDADPAGIVFFARLFDFAHDGYVAFLDAHEVRMAQEIPRGAWIAPLSGAEARFLAPLRFGEDAMAEVVGKQIQGSRVRLFHRVHNPTSVSAVLRTDHVFVSPQSFDRVPLPKAVVTALSRLPDLDVG
ncbi:MAG: thioesterase family protein [Myxococcota bacterium]